MNWRTLSTNAGLLLGLLIAGCGQVSAPAGSAASQAAQAKGAAASAAGGTAWQEVIAGAKREGSITIISQSGTDISKALSDSFETAYPGIHVELTAGNGNEVSTKVLTERAAGRFSSDLIVHGTTTIVNSLLPVGALDPIVPFLTGPNDSDASKWRGGNFNFADSAGQYDVIFTGGVHVPLIYNPSAVSPGDIRSFRDLLDAKWKGKITMFDPRGAGSGLSMATLFYRSPTLGKEFVQQLFTQQNIAFAKEDRQLTDWVARGEYPVGLAQQDFAALELKKKGVPLESLPPDAIKEPTYLNAGWGSVGVMNKAPHPNATRLYLDWLLSREGQGVISSVSGYASRRMDAPTQGLPDYVIPKAGVQYLDDASEENQRYKTEVLAYVKMLIG